MQIETTGVYTSLVLTALIAVWAVWRTRRVASRGGDTGSYFTARGFLDRGRLFFSVFATTFSAFTVVGLPAMFYAQGLGTLIWMGVGILLTPLIVQTIGKRIISRAKGSDAGSVIGLLVRGYGSQALMLILSIVTVVVLFPYLALQIAGIGKFLLSASDGGITYFAGTVFVCIIVALYVSTGGAAADAETDFVQGPILLAGTFILGALVLYNLVGSAGETVNTLSAAGLLSIPGPRGYFTPSVLISFGIIFTFISVSTPQVSQRLMGAASERDLNPVIWIYAPVGLLVVVFAGLLGLYAAANLEISSPDFVAGDVLRSLASTASEGWLFAYNLLAILFITAVISAAVSTVDSILIAVAGIASDNLDNPVQDDKKRQLRFLAWVLLFAGILFSANPPRFIVELAGIQLSGLTALLPCLLGPLFGYDKVQSGWSALVFGLGPIFIGELAGVDFWGVDPGVVGLASGTLALLIAHAVGNSKEH